MKSVYKYEKKTIKLATMLDALAHPARLQILLFLSGHKGCPAGSISDYLPISKSTVSKHLSKLKEVGLIICIPKGVCLNYQLNDEILTEMKEYFSDFIDQINMGRNKGVFCSPAYNSNPRKGNTGLEENEQTITTTHKQS